jgi:hypothetical protein
MPLWQGKKRILLSSKTTNFYRSDYIFNPLFEQFCKIEGGPAPFSTDYVGPMEIGH